MLELLLAGGAAALGAAAGAALTAHRCPREGTAGQTLAQLCRQLTDPEPAVRLAAVAGLERHGVDHPDDRQGVIDLICQHLRTAPAPPAAPDVSHRAAQRLFRMRLNTDYERDCWAPLNLDLSGAHLDDLDLSGCMIGELVCRGTHFHGTTRITDAIINRAACFEDAVFTDDAEFTDTYFGGPLRLTGVQWHGGADFEGAGYKGDELKLHRTDCCQDCPDDLSGIP